MKTAIYIRVSTDEQAEEGYSIEAQRRRLLAYVESQDWQLYNVYVDEGYSAKDLERPALKELLQAAEDRQFEAVLVYKLDRLTRSAIDCDSLLKLFDKNDVKFQSATESFETRTATGRLFIRLVADIAQWERENIAERVRFGMEQMVKEGKRPGAPLPFGYDQNGQVIEEEKEILRELRRLYLCGKGYQSIARELNKRGLFHRGAEWSTGYIRYCLDNPFYAGFIRWGKEGKSEAIIQTSDHGLIFTKEEYEEHVSRMSRRSEVGHTSKVNYWFSGLLKCGRCGGALLGRREVRKRVRGKDYVLTKYICWRRQQKSGCDLPMIRQELVEHLFLNKLKEIVDERKMEFDYEDHDFTARLLEEIESLSKDLQKVKERKRKWQIMYADNLLSIEELREHNEESRQQESALASKILEIETRKSSIGDSAYKPELVTLLNVWEQADDIEKQRLVSAAFEFIVIDAHVTNPRGGNRGQFIPAYIKDYEFI